jgi:MFS superfamily sulfate permease-like transporter
MFKPKLFDTLKNYNRQQFSKDLMAGLIVGLVALPPCYSFCHRLRGITGKGYILQLSQDL